MVPFKLMRLAGLPTEASRQITPDDRTARVGEPRRELLGRNDVLAVDLDVGRRIDEEVGIEILLRLALHTPEPAAKRDLRHAGDGLNAFEIRERQSLGERRSVAHREAIGGGALHARVPEIDDGLQKDEGKNADGRGDDRERKPETVAKEIANHEPGESHDKAPLSMWRMRSARAAAAGSWVTMTMVLPSSWCSC